MAADGARSAGASAPIVVPVPQHMESTGAALPLGAIVLADEAHADSWAVTTLRRGVERLGMGAPLASAPHGEAARGSYTLLTITSDPAAVRTLLRQCQERFGRGCALETLGDQGYMLGVGDRADGPVRRVTIAAQGGAGQAYGVDTFVQLIAGGTLPRVLMFDYPAVRNRVYGGGRNDDWVATLRFNIGRGVRTEAEITQMRLRHVEPWATIHPSHAYAGQPGLCYSDAEAIERAIAPLVEAAQRGVRWLGMNFDDIDLRLGHADDVTRFGTIGKAHVHFINGTYARLRAINPDVRLSVIPIIYGNIWLAGTWVYAVDEGEIYDYLTTLGREVAPEVIFIWTGESIESVTMTDEGIRQWTDLVRRKPFIFENTPTGDLTDLGALKFRTANAGDLLDGWIYISRGPQAELAELTTAEYLWNPRAYDPKAALTRAICRAVGAEAAPAMERLISVFSYGEGVRYRHPIWREGRLLEVVEPDDDEVADFYVRRMQVISEVLPVLERLILELPFYQAVRKIALNSTEVGRAYLETYIMLKSAARGERKEALAAGDRVETLHQEWTRYSTGSTDLHSPSDRRDAITYIEQIGVARRLRALRRGGREPIPWVNVPAAGQKGEIRLGRTCAALRHPNDRVRLSLRSDGSRRWLVVTAAGPGKSAVRLEVNGRAEVLPEGAWTPDRWRSVAVAVPGGSGVLEVALAVDHPTDWALARAALIADPSAERLLHATRSSVAFGAERRVEAPRRFLRAVETDLVEGLLAVRSDIELKRAASGRYFPGEPGTCIGQTFHMPRADEEMIAPKDPVHLLARESSDGDFLHAMGVMFQHQGERPLALDLWRWAGSVEETVGGAGNRIATTLGRPGTPFAPSHHWVLFPLDVELDEGTTYYAELTAPEGWNGWRLHAAFGWYGYRYDPTRSAYVNGKIDRDVDIPFRTYVCDVYVAERKR